MALVLLAMTMVLIIIRIILRRRTLTIISRLRTCTLEARADFSWLGALPSGASGVAFGAPPGAREAGPVPI
eukprot:9490815-Pyramimonas_sp.AAC.1